MLFQAHDRVAERPFLGLVGRAVAQRIVGRRVRGTAVGEELDDRRALVGAGALFGPLGRGPDGEEVVAVDAQGRKAIADGLGGEGGLKPAGDALEGRDGPLVVDDVEDHRGAVDRGEGQGVVEVAFRRGAVADPGDGDLVVALVGAGHGPADSLRHLGAEVARDGEEAEVLGRIHDRQLTAFDGVRGVRIDLVHHGRERITARDQQALLAIGGEAHVLARQDHALGDGDGLLARAFHIEAGLALTVSAMHPVVEGAGQDHGLEAPTQGLGVQFRIPRADGLAVIGQHADQPEGMVAHVEGLRGNLGTLHHAGGVQLQMTEVRRVSGPARRLGHTQRKGLGIGLFHSVLPFGWSDRVSSAAI